MSDSLNEIKWAEANAEIGLKHNEICPGLTVKEHAESLAMFDMHGLNGSNKLWGLTVKVMEGIIKKRLMAGTVETI